MNSYDVVSRLDSINFEANHHGYFLRNIMKLIAGLVLIAVSNGGFSQSLTPYVGRYFAEDCNSTATAVSSFLAYSPSDGRYGYAIYKDKKEVLRSSGVADLLRDGNIRMVEWWMTASGGKPATAHVVIKPLDRGFQIIYEANEGRVRLKDGKEVYTEEPRKIRPICSVNSPAVVANVGSNPSTIQAPPPLPIDLRGEIIEQKTRLHSPTAEDLEFNLRRVKEVGAEMEKDNRRTFRMIPQLCRYYYNIGLATDVLLQDRPERKGDPKFITTEKAQDLCASVYKEVINGLERYLSGRNSFTEAECNDMKWAVAQAKEGGWPSQFLDGLNKASQTVCSSVKSPIQGNLMADLDRLNEMVKGFTGIRDCGSYNNAKATCAPAYDFQSCMSRLGVGSSTHRTMCASPFSPNGW